MNAYDYYGEARALADVLKNAGFPAYGSDILGAMEEGETGTEIFMMMRARLANLLVDGKLPPDLIARVRALHGRLNDVLT
ncbi:hypothetical protein VSR34_22770 [Paraburkholderia sp. JHI2823]|uniref:hypothetical protein n=1 Tax=Paraburkholderia TaxID=1822464 RepID=UPI000485F21E|nr:hypothetical protein [Paraburkholderia mimosarum]